MCSSATPTIEKSTEEFVFVWCNELLEELKERRLLKELQKDEHDHHPLREVILANLITVR